MKHLKKIAVLLIVLIVICGFAFKECVTRPGPLVEAVNVIIPKGFGSKAVAFKLEEAGVIKWPYAFMILGSLNGLDKKLKAGEYLFDPHASMISVMRKIASGDVFFHRMTLPEGLTKRQFFDIIKANEALDGEISLDVAEGDMLPETYAFERGTLRDEIIRQARMAMEKIKISAFENRMEGLPIKNVDEMMVLASIIEKETALSSERRVVASVFVNRLKKGMMLQTDPTVIYAITKGQYDLGRLLTRTDLQIDDRYNTYKYYGLPPGPICNPSRESILAAVNPEATPYLYFVADGSGGHKFSTSLSEHNQNVRNWKNLGN